MIVDIITLSGITASDGTTIEAGAVVKFDSEFYAGSSDIRVRPRIFRSREFFENGFDSVGTNKKIGEFKIQLSNDDYYTLTPLNLYHHVANTLNEIFDGQIFEVSVTEE